MRSYSHLSEDERDQIGVLRAAGRSMGAIARALGRAKATISRELQRNALPLGGYSPLHAAGAYQLRRRREAILEREAALRLFVGDRLAEGWTPEQISGWLKSGNEPRLRAIGCETIYAFIYRAAQKAAALWRYLTRRHKRRRPRRARASRDAIKDRASIHDRPKTIEGRGEAGHWEAWIPERSATCSREADLNVLSKLGNQGLEWRLEPEAFTRREVRREDDRSIASSPSCGPMVTWRPATAACTD